MHIKQPTAADIPHLRQLWKEAFGDTDAFLDGFFRTGFDATRCRCTEDISAALYWFDCQWQDKKLAYLYAVATAKAHQGQGLCRRLMEDTHRHLLNLGYAGAILVPGNEGLFRLYEKLGYRPCCPRQVETVDGSTLPVSVTLITAADYAAARKKSLPAHSVWQDAVALDFLGTFAQFYAGDGFVFCGAVEDNILYFQEFIGDMEQTPGIIREFNCLCGELPVFGSGAPYAMYRSLDGDASLPTYFGIPLN